MEREQGGEAGAVAEEEGGDGVEGEEEDGGEGEGESGDRGEWEGVMVEWMGGRGGRGFLARFSRASGYIAVDGAGCVKTVRFLFLRTGMQELGFTG